MACVKEDCSSVFYKLECLSDTNGQKHTHLAPNSTAESKNTPVDSSELDIKCPSSTLTEVLCKRVTERKARLKGVNSTLGDTVPLWKRTYHIRQFYHRSFARIRVSYSTIKREFPEGMAANQISLPHLGELGASE